MRVGRGALAGAIAVTIALGCMCGPPDCPEGERVEGDSCVPDECGEYPFGPYAGAKDVVFVQAYADDARADGSEDHPFPTVGAAIGLALSLPERPAVVIASGSYTEALLLDDRHDKLALVGVCERDVVISGPDDDRPALDLEASPETAVGIGAVTFTSPTSAALAVGGGELVLLQTSVRGAVGAGLVVAGTGARATLTDVSLSGVRRSDALATGYGLAVGYGATVTGAGVSVADTEIAGVYVDGATLEVSDLRVDGDPLGAVATGGIAATGGATLDLDGVVLTNLWGFGLDVDGGTATLDGVEIHAVGVTDLVPELAGIATGLAARGGATVDVTALTVTDAAGYGVAATDGDTALTASAVTVTDAAPRSEGIIGAAGLGVVATADATATFTDLVVERAAVFGVGVADGATLTLAGATVRDTVPTGFGTGPEAALAGGVLAQSGGVLDATDLTVEGCGTIGILADGADATLAATAVDGTVRGTFQSAAAGIAVQAGATVAAEDLVVTGTEGPGVYVTGADATLTDVTLDGNAFAGLAVLDGAATVTGGSILATGADANEGGGVGVFVDSGPGPADVVLDAVTVRGNLHAGVYVAGDGHVDIRGSTLAGGPSARALWPTGTGVFAVDTSAAGLVLTDNDLVDAAGVGVFLDGADATFAGNRYDGNALDVIVQRCTAGVPALPGLDAESATTDVCPAVDRPVDPFAIALVYVPLSLAAR